MLEIRGMITEIKQYNTTIPFEDLYYCKIWGVYVRASLYIQVWGGLRRPDPAIAVCCYVVCFCEIRSRRAIFCLEKCVPRGLHPLIGGIRDLLEMLF
jgi:hypothetical protein